ncbi:hypothetical protein [Nocardia cyriacigeorgica]|uniref:hypothetical protein n=1 Tax=Nocardia cyriacigeorgica TaxID=135487 RepID=UPI0018949A68|nr:hypothetical protein [Nocardia cyriacigeorgica]MBF6554385.1 hypothetical protein [Nocardia cyriacigeorgica]
MLGERRVDVRNSWPSHLCAQLRKGPPCRNRTTVGNPSAATTPSADTEAAAIIGATAVPRGNAAVGAEAETTNAERAEVTTAPTEAAANVAASRAVDATAGNPAKAGRLGADRAMTAIAAHSSVAATGTAATIAAGTGTGVNPTAAARPKAGHSGGIAATTHRDAIRATERGTTVAAGGASADRHRTRTAVDTADPVIEMIGAAETGANGARPARIGADTAGRAIGTSDADPMTGADTTTPPVHRSVAATGPGSVVIGTAIRGPAVGRTSATGPVGSGAPATRHRATTGRAAGTIATAVRTRAVSGAPRTTLAPGVTTAQAAEMTATVRTGEASGARRKSLVADATIEIVAGTTVTGVRTRAGSGVPRMTFASAATTAADPTRVVSGAATADGRALRAIVRADSDAQEANPAAGAAVDSVAASSRADAPSVDMPSGTTRAPRAGAAVVSGGRTTVRRSGPSRTPKRAIVLEPSVATSRRSRQQPARTTTRT